MKIAESVMNMYRSYREFKKTNKIYRAAQYTLAAVLSVYAILLIFPQLMFAHSVSHGQFIVYANQKLDQSVIDMLDRTENKLLRSPIYRKGNRQNVFIAGSHGFHNFVTLNSRAFGSTIPFVGHIRINKSDFENDLVFRDTDRRSKRSLSGVIAHEVMHNQIRIELGFAKYMSLPRWKEEGYCEYIAGDITLSRDEGIELWREKRADPSLDYFKYQQMVRYLLEVKGESVRDLFTEDYDESNLKALVMKDLGIDS